MSEFIIEEEDKSKGGTPKIRTPRINKQEIIDRLIKMFRAAMNGKNYYKKFFPECKDTGDFEALYTSELYKLK